MESNKPNEATELPQLNQRRPGPILVCFAVKLEAKPFLRHAARHSHVRVLITGIGPRNAQSSLRNLLSRERPTLVISAGFAGGLHPDLGSGTVLFAATPESGLEDLLVNAGARPATFHCADRIATTAQEKRALRKSFKTDAVEMESAIITEICCSEQIPTAAIRVILDTADEDLPLDFNHCMTRHYRMNYPHLVLTLIRKPSKIGSLLRLQTRGAAAAEKLAQVLSKVLLRIQRRNQNPIDDHSGSP